MIHRLLSTRLLGIWGRISAFGLGYAWARLKLRLAGKGSLQDYATWISLFDTPSHGHIRRVIRRLPCRPVFSVLMPIWDEAAAKSVSEQLYVHWELLTPALPNERFTDPRFKSVPRSSDCTCVANALLEKAEGDFVVVLLPGDILSPSALFHLARVANPKTDLIYGDEDRLVGGVRCEPIFRPAYFPELLYDPAGMGLFAAWRRGEEAFRPAAGKLIVYDILLRVAERASLLPRSMGERRDTHPTRDLPYPPHPHPPNAANGD